MDRKLNPGEGVIEIDNHEVAVEKAWWASLSKHQPLGLILVDL